MTPFFLSVCVYTKYSYIFLFLIVLKKTESIFNIIVKQMLENMATDILKRESFYSADLEGKRLTSIQVTLQYSKVKSPLWTLKAHILSNIFNISSIYYLQRCGSWQAFVIFLALTFPSFDFCRIWKHILKWNSIRDEYIYINIIDKITKANKLTSSTILT